MTYAITLSTLTNSIAALSVSGVTIKDIDQISSSYQMAAATLAPRPERFVTDFSIAADELSKQKLTARYTLNYVYYHTQIGSVLDFAEYSDCMTNILAIISALTENHILSGAIDTELPTVNDIGAVSDPAGNLFFGCTISIRVVQLVN